MCCQGLGCAARDWGVLSWTEVCCQGLGYAVRDWSVLPGTGGWFQGLECAARDWSVSKDWVLPETGVCFQGFSDPLVARRFQLRKSLNGDCSFILVNSQFCLAIMLCRVVSIFVKCYTAAVYMMVMPKKFVFYRSF